MVEKCGDSSKVERLLSQTLDGGSIPTSPLCISPRDLNVVVCGVSDIRDFIEKNHYSHNINGVKIKHCFKVEHKGVLVGGVLFGAMSTTAWKKFSDCEKKVLELRRLVIVDIAGKNSESRVIGFCLRWIRKIDNDVEVVVSYADPYHNHDGTIYKASNFEYLGLSGKDNGFKDKDTGKTYHSRALRTKYKGDYKPFVKILRDKLEKGILVPFAIPPKHCFVFKFKK